ncbi:MAG: hypothetical protein LBI68_00195 [Azoarcus sp.]|jgi:hypothetical protein|nr:hypothetical protein [Azoarcus sp.]
MFFIGKVASTISCASKEICRHIHNQFTKQEAGLQFILPTVLLGSIFLSLISSLSNPILGRDASLYLSIATDSSVLDVSSALELFDWPWYSLLIGIISRLSGFPPEIIARLSCESMTAIACLLSVDIVRKTRPDLTGWAALIVLTIPAFNEYRGEVLRENGFWCFSMLALWSMYKLEDAHRIYRLSFVCLSTVIAAAFRFEAVYIFIVFAITEFSRIQGKTLKIAVAFGSLASVAIVLFYLLHHGLLPDGRVTSFVSRIDPLKILNNFSDFSQYVALKLPKYTSKNSEQLLFLGLCGYLISKIISALGIFSIPWVLGWRLPRKARALTWDHLTIAAIGYCGILLIFLINTLFISGRFIAFLGFLFLPRISAGIHYIVNKYPKTFLPIIILSITLAISNSVSLSEPKTFIRDAGIWIGNNLSKEDRIYFEDARIRYYAQWGYVYKNRDQDKETALAIEGDESYEYFALDLGCQRQLDHQIKQLQEKGLHLLASFKNKRGCSAAVFRRSNVPATSQADD